MRYKTVQSLLKEAKIRFPDIKTIGELKEKAREIQKEKFGTLCESSIYVHDVSTKEAVSRAGNHMAEFGNYPTGMSICEIVGINGGCGKNCPQFQDGECENFDYDKDEWK